MQSLITCSGGSCETTNLLSTLYVAMMVEHTQTSVEDVIIASIVPGTGKREISKNRN